MIQKAFSVKWLILLMNIMPIYLVFIFLGFPLFAMEEKCKMCIRGIQMIEENGEIIYSIEEKLDELLKNQFEDLAEVVRNGEFEEAKNWLKKCCIYFKTNFCQRNSNSSYSIDELKELLEEFRYQSKLLLKSLNNDFTVVKLEFDDTIRKLGLLGALSIASAGGLAVNTGAFVIASAMVLVLSWKPIALLFLGLICGLFVIANEPELFFELAFLASSTIMLFLQKINNKMAERKRHIKSIKKLVDYFIENLEALIKMHPDNFRETLNFREKIL